MDESRLAKAAAEAVAHSAPLARELSGMFEELAREVRPPTAGSGDASVTAEQRTLFDEEQRLRNRAAELVQELAGDRLAALDTFNIVLFGRTGVGKSSLVEAFTGGDGRRISPGRTDHTTEVEETRWAGLRLFDTPGTNGWGRDGDNRDLEEAARRAVLLADVVLLCFDDGSQLEGEFTTVAQWVLAYGKPVVVVLNCMVRPWRDPDLVSRRDVRVHLSETVAEHAAHIRDWLASCGLPDVPLVALSAQRAVAARAAAPYQGWDARTVQDMRRRADRPTLLKRSNLPTLETLLTEAVGVDAAQLRHGGLLRQTAGALGGLAEEITTVLAEPARQAAETIEAGLEELLSVLGAPQDLLVDTDAARAVPEQVAYAHTVRALGELQSLRGGPFAVPARAEVRNHLDHLLTSGFGALRSTLEARAEDLVNQAFRERRPLSGEEFNAAVFRSDELTATVEKATESFTSYVQGRVGLIAADVEAGLSQVDTQVDGHTGRVRGDTGAGYRALGRGAGYTSAAAGLLGAGFSVAAALNIWNPVGWAMVGLAVAAGVGRLTALFGLRRGQQRRDAALGDQLEQARAAVDRSVEDLRERVAAHCTGIVRRAVLLRAGPGIHQAVAVRRTAAAAARDAARLTAAVRALPPARDAADILVEAMGRAEASAGVTHPAEADRYWLGSDWCDDPHNLISPDGTAVRRSARRTPRLSPNVLDRLREAFRSGPPGPTPGSGLQWLHQVRRDLAEDPHATGVIAELDTLAADPRPRIAIAGDLSTGKSAFVRRLLVESGAPVPDSLRSAAGPETFRAETYAWEDVLLVDTPGFQSGRETHTAAARAALADATAVIYLFSPQLLVGDRADLTFLLRGDPKTGGCSKQGRLLWVINKVDRIAVADPARDLRSHVEHRESALADALEQVAPTPPGRPPHRERIVSMAAAPYGLRSHHSRDYDDFRAWDGFRDFAAAVRRLRLTLERNSLDVTLLHGGAARLGALRADALRHAEVLQRRITETGRLAEEALAGARSGRGLVRSVVVEAERLATAFTTRLVHEALEAGVDAPVRKARGKRLDDWHEDKEFAGAWERHSARTRRSAQEWLGAVASALDRRVASPSYLEAFPEAEDRVDLSFLTRESLQVWGRDIASGASTALTSVAELTPDDIVTLAAHLDVVVSADHVQDLLHTVNNAGIFLKVVNAVSLLSALNEQDDREAKVEASRTLLLSEMRARATAWARSRRGGCGAVEEVCVRLEETAVVLTETQGGLLTELEETRDRAARYAAAIAGARLRLECGDGDDVKDGQG
ncbi:GTPase [Streptomyces sp. NPDC001388]|uniref:GTPase n=1 Tax=Streptomyces sp. NPDC001388 TaxID=3364568 RepID=UPI0036C8A501